MKRTPKPVFFIVAILILALSYTAVFGVYTRYGDRTDTVIRGISEIRWGIDIQGGVDVTFGPTDENIEVTAAQLDGVKKIIEQRLVSKNITDYEAYTDASSKQVIVRFPWSNTEETPEEAVAEIGQTAMLEFHYGKDTDSNGKPTGGLILNGDDPLVALFARGQRRHQRRQRRDLRQLQRVFRRQVAGGPDHLRRPAL